MNTKTTSAIRTGVCEDSAWGSVMPPLYLSSNYRFASPEAPPTFDYTRSGNPTRNQLTEALATLESGSTAVATSSGMSAVLVALQLLGPNDLVVATHDCYGGTHRLIRAMEKKGQIRALFIDMNDEGAFQEALSLRPRMIWVETPSNPLLRVTDLRRVATAAREIEAIAVADNTFLSPALQRPLELGFDVVVHSTTKFINGHSDVVGGAVIAKAEALGEELAWWANCLGVTQSPFDSYQTLRGLRTLFARTAVHAENAREVVEALLSHEGVSRVYYPGIEGHPGHEVAKEQQDGFGSIVSFELAGGANAVNPFLEQLRLFTLAESLGGVESLICHPWSMTHASMEEEARVEAGIGRDLLRISVGIESADDLVADLSAALDATSDQLNRVPAESPQVKDPTLKSPIACGSGGPLP